MYWHTRECCFAEKADASTLLGAVHRRPSHAYALPYQVDVLLSRERLAIRSVGDGELNIARA